MLSWAIQFWFWRASWNDWLSRRCCQVLHDCCRLPSDSIAPTFRLMQNQRAYINSVQIPHWEQRTQEEVARGGIRDSNLCHLLHIQSYCSRLVSHWSRRRRPGCYGASLAECHLLHCLRACSLSARAVHPSQATSQASSSRLSAAPNPTVIATTQKWVWIWKLNYEVNYFQSLDGISYKKKIDIVNSKD